MRGKLLTTATLQSNKPPMSANTSKIPVAIAGTVESIVDTSDEWITSRTGIKSRHIAAEGENTSDLATEAAKNALENAGIDAADIEHQPLHATSNTT